MPAVEASSVVYARSLFLAFLALVGPAQTQLLTDASSLKSLRDAFQVKATIGVIHDFKAYCQVLQQKLTAAQQTTMNLASWMKKTHPKELKRCVGFLSLPVLM